MDQSDPSDRTDPTDLRPSPVPPLDLNCDLGEHEAPALTAALCAVVQRVNVACGGHAGDDDSMRRVIALAATHGLHLGAHPGQPGNFGRGPVHLSPTELAQLVEAQVTRLASLAATPLSHIKLHGSLYHHAEEHPDAAEAFVELLASQFPRVAAVSLPGRALEAACRRHGVPFLAEGFLDRAYRDDGTLVPRGTPGAILDSPERITARLQHWRETGHVLSVTGRTIPLPVQTWCLHADTPNVLNLVPSSAAFHAR
jgi:5-oxoprolinase (ATP-hydrolysing) subunit A